jgi:peptidylprolyl isomerase
MTRPLGKWLALAAVGMLLVGCADGPDPTKGGTVTAPVGVASTSSMPGVEGAQGAKPTITVPRSAPPAEPLMQPIVAGPGSPVEAGQQIIGKYVGMTWSGREFASSWEVPELDIVQSANHLPPMVIEKLAGVTAGSRVLVVVPPSAGFGEAGRPDLGISPGDTLVYVVDIFGSF